jgi:hypothetical protein
MKKNTTFWLAGIAWLLLAANPAFAQAPEGKSSFESLGSDQRLKSGERIEVTDVSGKKLSGRFENISGSVLTVRQGQSMQQFTKADIAEIRHRKPERWWDGMLIGMGAGAAAGFVGARMVCGNDSECSFYTGVVLVPTLTGGGAAIGALIDSLIHKNETVYSRDTGSLLRRLNVSPLAGKGTAGVRLSLSF